MMMKTMMKICLMLLLAAPFSSYASLDPVVRVKNIETKGFALYMHGLTGQVQISIKDKYGYILHQENLKDLIDYAEKYNLKELPSGDYFLEVEDATSLKVFPIAVQGKEVTLSADAEIYKPELTQSEKFVDVTRFFLNPGPLTIAIWDQKGELVFKETFSGGKELRQRYDLTAMEAGSYRFSFQVAKRTFSETVDIEK